MLLKWTKKLSLLPLCVSPEVCADDYMVNAAAISDDGSRVVAGTYYQNYVSTSRKRVDGRYGLYVFTTAGSGTLLFSHEYNGDKGIYAVAMSGDGTVAAGGGLLTMGKASPFKPKRGMLLAFDVPTGTKLLETSDITDRVTSVGLSGNGHVLVAVADKTLLVFLRGSSGTFSNPPHVIDLIGYCETVAVHPSGTWLAAADQQGVVYVIPITGGAVGTPVTWIASEPLNPANPLSLKAQVKFHSIAVSRASDAFAVGGWNFVYLLTRASMSGSKPGPVARFSSFDLAGGHNVRWVAIGDDGSFVTTVVNDTDHPTHKGLLIRLSPSAGLLTPDFKAALKHPPNSTSVDSSGTLMAVADGFPNFTPGAFYLFDNTGATLDTHNTTDMNWPIQISADGSGIVGGSDTNTLSFFTP
jgi:WD40 repeat protein